MKNQIKVIKKKETIRFFKKSFSVENVKVGVIKNLDDKLYFYPRRNFIFDKQDLKNILDIIEKNEKSN